MTDGASRQTLVVLLGPSAVGKMTVGRALEARLGFPLFHNHLTIELVLPFFPFGSPPFGRLVESFRRQLFDEVAASDLPGLTFTFVCAFDMPGEVEYLRGIQGRFEERGWQVVFVELWADLEVRLARNRTEDRLREKPSKRDVAASEQRLLEAEQRYQLRSSGPPPFAEYLRLDSTHLSAEEVAARIIDHFGLASR